MAFKDIIGNEKNKNFLIKAINSNNIAHSYMFEGIEGIGKNLIAKEFAKRILCLNKTEGILNEKNSNKFEYGSNVDNIDNIDNIENSKNTDKFEGLNEEDLLDKTTEAECFCKSCIEFDAMNNPDFIEVVPDGKIIKIDQIRKMQEKILEKPIVSEKKVYIINDADLMTKEAQNCLLKTLEEPPKYVVIILVLANESKILNTIKSRCIKLSFEKLSKDEIKTYINKNFPLENIPNGVIENCGGSISRLIRIKENIEIYNNLEEFTKKFEKDNILDIIKSADVLYKNKDIIDDILDYMIRIFYNTFVNNPQKTCYINVINEIESTKQKLKINSNFDMSIDNLIFKIWEEVNENCNRG